MAKLIPSWKAETNPQVENLTLRVILPIKNFTGAILIQFFSA